jgi:four helix bundle protein
MYSMAQTYRDSTASQLVMELNIQIYALTETFPADDASELASQLRRASDSAEKNLAEAIEFRGRMADGEFRQFLGIAQGSTYEVQTQLLVAKQLRVGDQEMLRKAEDLCVEISKMLGAFIQSLGARS